MWVATVSVILKRVANVASHHAAHYAQNTASQSTKKQEVHYQIIIQGNNMNTYRFRGLRKDGELIQSNNLDDFPLQDFFWFEETTTMTPEMYENLRLRSNLPPYQAK